MSVQLERPARMVHPRAGTPRGSAPDADLVARCRRGDSHGWDLLVEHYSSYVYSIVSRGFRLNEHHCEDVFQEVFLRLYGRLDTIRDPSALRFWIGQTARRLAVDQLRAGKREAPAWAEETLDGAGRIDPALERIELSLDLLAGLDALPARSSEVVVRFFIHDESYRTIGAAMEIPEGTVASRISRGVAALREHLHEEPAGAADARAAVAA